MHDLGLLAGTLATIYLGFFALALTQQRHWGAFLSPPFPSRRARVAVRAGASLALAAALPLAVARDGASFGSIMWAIELTLGGMLVVLTLTLRRSQTSRSASSTSEGEQ